MGVMNNVAADIDASNTGVSDLIIMLADAAGTLRAVKANNLPMPLVCGFGCNPARQWAFGRNRFCLACGRAALPADTIHAAIVRMLRARVRVQERTAA